MNLQYKRENKSKFYFDMACHQAIFITYGENAIKPQTSRHEYMTFDHCRLALQMMHLLQIISQIHPLKLL